MRTSPSITRPVFLSQRRGAGPCVSVRLTYSTAMPRSTKASAASRAKVDLPAPGSPRNSTTMAPSPRLARLDHAARRMMRLTARHTVGRGASASISTTWTVDGKRSCRTASTRRRTSRRRVGLARHRDFGRHRQLDDDVGRMVEHRSYAVASQRAGCGAAMPGGSTSGRGGPSLKPMTWFCGRRSQMTIMPRSRARTARRSLPRFSWLNASAQITVASVRHRLLPGWLEGALEPLPSTWEGGPRADSAAHQLARQSAADGRPGCMSPLPK